MICMWMKLKMFGDKWCEWCEWRSCIGQTLPCRLSVTSDAKNAVYYEEDMIYETEWKWCRCDDDSRNSHSGQCMVIWRSFTRLAVCWSSQSTNNKSKRKQMILMNDMRVRSAFCSPHISSSLTCLCSGSCPFAARSSESSDQISHSTHIHLLYMRARAMSVYRACMFSVHIENNNHYKPSENVRLICICVAVYSWLCQQI